MILLLAGLLAHLWCFPAHAQVSGGALSGVVTNTSQVAMPGAQVTLKNAATGVARVVTTGAGGLYTSPNLDPGTYEMRVEASGFTTQVRTGITVTVGAKLAVNVTMRVGDPKEVIRGALSVIPEDQASAVVSGNVSASTVRDSPLNGRDWTQLAAGREILRGVVPRPIPVVGIRETLFGAYAQDDIRVRRGLNVSLGLRYEMNTVPAEAHNLLSNLLSLTDARPHLGSPFFLNPTLRNFEPRVGLAWSPFAGDKTIVRTGFGMFDVLPLPNEFALTIPNAAPFVAQDIRGRAPRRLISCGGIPTVFRQLDGFPRELEVADSGPGIPLEHREKVLDRFYRVDAARSRDAGGSGLGLSIARWAVEAHGGVDGLARPRKEAGIHDLAVSQQ